MCACDGVESTDLISGQPVTFTAFGKVEGANTTKARIQDFSFVFTKYTTDPTHATLIAQSNPLPAQIVEQRPGLIRYKATWTVTIPSAIDLSANYQVTVQHITCKPSLLTAQPVSTQTVMAAETRQPTFLEAIWSALLDLATGQSTPLSSQPNQNLTPTAVITPQEKTLHLQTFTPARIIQRACQALTFKFGF